MQSVTLGVSQQEMCGPKEDEESVYRRMKNLV